MVGEAGENGGDEAWGEWNHSFLGKVKKLGNPPKGSGALNFIVWVLSVRIDEVIEDVCLTLGIQLRDEDFNDCRMINMDSLTGYICCSRSRINILNPLGNQEGSNRETERAELTPCVSMIYFLFAAIPFLFSPILDPILRDKHGSLRMDHRDIWQLLLFSFCPPSLLL